MSPDLAPLVGPDSQLDGAVFLQKTLQEVNQRIRLSGDSPQSRARSQSKSEMDLQDVDFPFGLLFTGAVGLILLRSLLDLEDFLNHDLEEVLFPTSAFRLEALVTTPRRTFVRALQNMLVDTLRRNYMGLPGYSHHPEALRLDERLFQVPRQGNPDWPLVTHHLSLRSNPFRDYRPSLPVTNLHTQLTVDLEVAPLDIHLAVALQRLYWACRASPPSRDLRQQVCVQASIVRTLVEFSEEKECRALQADSLRRERGEDPLAGDHRWKWSIARLASVCRIAFCGSRAAVGAFHSWLQTQFGAEARMQLAEEVVLWTAEYDVALRGECRANEAKVRLVEAFEKVYQLLETQIPDMWERAERARARREVRERREHDQQWRSSSDSGEDEPETHSQRQSESEDESGPYHLSFSHSLGKPASPFHPRARSRYL
ncbi:hypothetical protein JCM10213_004589 [Rhodosporidiobolus nylandii]